MTLCGRPIDLLKGPTSVGVGTMRSRKYGVLVHHLSTGSRDAPGEPVKSALRYALVVPNGYPPGLQIGLQPDGQTFVLARATQPHPHAAAPSGPMAVDKGHADELLAEGFEPIELPSIAPPRRGKPAAPIYGYLKFSAEPDEPDAGAEEARTTTVPLHAAISSSSASADRDEAEKRSVRPQSARARQREHKRKAAGKLGDTTPSTTEAADGLPQGALTRPSRTLITLPTHGIPARFASAAAASAPGTPHAAGQAMAVEHGALEARPAAAQRRFGFRTSIVRPLDLPVGVVLNLTRGGRTMRMVSGPNGSLSIDGTGQSPGSQQALALSQEDVQDPEAEGYTPVTVDVPQLGRSTSGKTPTKPYTLYIKDEMVEVPEDPEDGGSAPAGGLPVAETRRQQVAKQRKREAQRRAKLRAAQAQPGTATAASSSSSSSSSATAAAPFPAAADTAPAPGPDTGSQDDPGAPPATGAGPR